MYLKREKIALYNYINNVFFSKDANIKIVIAHMDSMQLNKG